MDTNVEIKEEPLWPETALHNVKCEIKEAVDSHADLELQRGATECQFDHELFAPTHAESSWCLETKPEYKESVSNAEYVMHTTIKTKEESCFVEKTNKIKQEALDPNSHSDTKNSAEWIIGIPHDFEPLESSMLYANEDYKKGRVCSSTTSSALENQDSLKKKQVTSILETNRIYKNTACFVDNSTNLIHEHNAHNLFNGSIKRYACTVCSKRFTWMSALILHNMFSKKHKKQIDVIQKKSCEKNSNLNPEFQTPFRSKICEKTGAVSTLTKAFKCEICEKGFTSRSGLQRHILTHIDNKGFKCDICNKSFSRFSYIKEHKQIHDSSRPYKCEVCNKGFSVRSYLKSHKQTHETSKPYKCDVCNKRFSYKTSLKVHGLIHEGTKQYKCEICGKSFSGISYFREHQKIHEGTKAYICEICQKRFTHMGSLKRHVALHEGTKPHKCEICKKTFPLLSYLKSHEQVHMTIKPHKCELCGKTFSIKAGLKRHILSHRDKIRYNCDVCQKSFAGLAYFKEHKKIHEEGQKAYACEMCNKSFTVMASLKTHVLTHNNGIKPFSCDICQKSFSVLSYLKAHKKIHEPNKPYKCTICNKSFHFKARLKMHTVTHVAIQP